MLFDAPILPGLAYRDDVIGPDEEAVLIEAIERIDFSPFRFQGWARPGCG